MVCVHGIVRLQGSSSLSSPLRRIQVSTDSGHFVYNVNLYHLFVYQSVCLSDIYQLLLYYSVYINVQNVVSVRS